MQETLSDCQYGYRKERGTADAVLEITNDIFAAKDIGQVTAACFLDIRKAFDSVSHNYLKQMLKEVNLPVKMLSWLKSYLENRTQRTKANGEYSEYMKLDYLVPQGSILGPLLFIYFINALPNVVDRCKVKIYADDVVLYVVHKIPLTARMTLQTELTKVANFCNTIGLTINTNKTKWLWFGTPQKLKKCPRGNVKIGVTVIKRVDSYTYLGAKLDSNLNLKQQAKITHAKVNVMAFKLADLRKKIDFDTAIGIYKQCILPKFDYCSFLTDSTIKYWPKRFESLQNKILRICLKVKKEEESTENLRKLCDVPLLATRRQELLTTQMFSKSKRLTHPQNADKGGR